MSNTIDLYAFFINWFINIIIIHDGIRFNRIEYIIIVRSMRILNIHIIIIISRINIFVSYQFIDMIPFFHKHLSFIIMLNLNNELFHC